MHYYRNLKNKIFIKKNGENTLWRGLYISGGDMARMHVSSIDFVWHKLYMAQNL